MNKINGYTEDEAKSLVEFVADGKKDGKTLSSLFAQYAHKSGRAKGSVRNYYYALLRSTGDDRVRRMLKDTDFNTEKPRHIGAPRGYEFEQRRRQAYVKIPKQIP